MAATAEAEAARRAAGFRTGWDAAGNVDYGGEWRAGRCAADGNAAAAAAAAVENGAGGDLAATLGDCLLYTSPSPRD